jgi:WD40 repeat protein
MNDDKEFEAFLQLDIGQHAGTIVQLLAPRGGHTLVSAGETTLRVWGQADEGKPGGWACRRMLLGRVSGLTDDGAPDGKVHRQALSRDGRWLVALKPWRHASLHGEDAACGHDAGAVTVVEVFELATGNLQSRFVHPGRLLDLDFSPDGRRLALAVLARAGRARRVEVWTVATRELLRPGARPPPPVLSRLPLGRPRRVPTLWAGLRFVPPAPGERRTGGAARLVVAVDDPGAATSRIAWLRLGGDGRLALAHAEDTAEPVAPDTLAVSAHRVAIAGTVPGGRKRRGRVHWLRHAEPDAGDAAPTERGVIDTEAPAASAAFSPSGHRLAVGLMVDRNFNAGARAGLQTVQVSVYEAQPLGAPVLRSTYLGHDGTVYGLCFVDDDTVASAGGDNQAIHLWPHDRRIPQAQAVIRGVGRVAIEPGITADERVLFGTVPLRLLPPGHAMRQQSFDLRRRVLSTTAASALRGTDFVSRKWLVGYPEDAVIPLWHLPDYPDMDPRDYEPDLSLFVGADDSWVLWTRSGYYDCGGGADAARRIGYRVNRGLHQEALLVPSDRFNAFYKPLVIEAVVRHGSEARARECGVPIPAVDVAGILPPLVELARGGIRKAGASAGFTFTVDSPCAGLLPTRASLLRNDRVVWTGRELPQRQRARCVVPPVPLLPGRNRFVFHAENAQAKSVPVAFEVEGPAPTAADEPAARTPGKLFLLSVGVGRFADPGTAPLRFPQRDAQAVFDAVGHGRLAPPRGRRGAPAKKAARRAGATAARNYAFTSVDARLLVDEQATKAAILAELDDLCARIRERHARAGAERDVLFVFLSGHGVTVREKAADAPQLFFQNHDLVPTADEVDATGLSMLDLGDRITSVPAEVVLVVDACHAALSGRGTMAGLDAEELARRVHAIYERGMYLVSASRASKKAAEDDASRFGVLTASLLRALAEARQHGARARRRKAPAAGIDVLMADLVAGVQRLVPELAARAGHRQTPVCRIYGDLLPLTILKT